MSSGLRDYGPMSDPFGEIPLFREIQKLIAAGGGPVNMEIARQIAAVAAAPGHESTRPEWDRAFAEDVRAAELVLSGYTRLVPDEPARSETMTRSSWATATLDAWRWLFETLATRFSSTFDRLSEGGEGSGMGQVMGQVVPLLMGVQAGSLVGQLAAETVSRYDLPVPRDDSGRIFVLPLNGENLAADYDLDVDHLRRWLALRDVARHMVFTSAPWVGRYMRSALQDIVMSVEIDLEDMERRITELGEQGMNAMQGMGASGALPVVPTEQHARALERFQTFVTVAEGYATHAVSEVAAEIVPDATRIEEGMTRHENSPSAGKDALTTLLGVTLDRGTRAPGVTFCSAVSSMRGVEALNRVWMAPDNLPTVTEVKDPFAWIERVLDA